MRFNGVVMNPAQVNLVFPIERSGINERSELKQVKVLLAASVLRNFSFLLVNIEI